jgi:hypothetical protein
MNQYTGTIIEESLEDNRMINNFEIVSVRITRDENPADRWHLYKIKSSKEDILLLANNIQQGTWYAHFWDTDNNIIAVFRDRIFEFKHDDISSWGPAVEYGKSIGIPDEQLDFKIE